MKFPGWFVRLLLLIGLGHFIEFDPILKCQDCGREIELGLDASEEDWDQACDAHDRFFHPERLNSDV